MLISLMVLNSYCCLCIGVVMSNGYLWKQQRKFALFTLKYFGVGKKSLEAAILDEFNHLARDIEEHNGKNIFAYHRQPYDGQFMVKSHCNVSHIIHLRIYSIHFPFCLTRQTVQSTLAYKLCCCQHHLLPGFWTSV